MPRAGFKAEIRVLERVLHFVTAEIRLRYNW